MIIREAKKQLRSHIKLEISKLSGAAIASQSHLVYQKLVSYEKFNNAKRIALYMAMPQEVQTLEIIKHCFDAGKSVYLPKCISEFSDSRKANHLHMLKVNSYEEVLQLKPHGKYKLLEPIQGESILEVGGLDIIIVPGVAFNEEGKRLGHGAGFYDEFLSTYQKTFNKKPHLIGIGLTEQLVHQIPVEEHDWVLDCVIAPELIT